ncbi:hypothetical protein AAKU67_003825, partial [Oxalobacteraceae bacterium GrIS 2.11]
VAGLQSSKSEQNWALFPPISLRLLLPRRLLGLFEIIGDLKRIVCVDLREQQASLEGIAAENTVNYFCHGTELMGLPGVKHGEDDFSAATYRNRTVQGHSYSFGGNIGGANRERFGISQQKYSFDFQYFPRRFSLFFSHVSLPCYRKTWLL